jgi:hypothetical protein
LPTTKPAKGVNPKRRGVLVRNFQCEVARDIVLAATAPASFVAELAVMADGELLLPVGGMAFQDSGAAVEKG